MAAHATATRIIEHHGQHLSETDQGEMYLIKQGVHALLQYKLSLLEICKLRVQSLESRSQNMINLVRRNREITEYISNIDLDTGLQYSQSTEQPNYEGR